MTHKPGMIVSCVVVERKLTLGCSPVEEMDEAQLDALLDHAERTLIDPSDFVPNAGGHKLDLGGESLG